MFYSLSLLIFQDVIDVRFYLEESLSLEPEEIPLEILHEDQELLIATRRELEKRPMS